LFGGEEGLEQSETAVSINDQMPRYAFEFLARKYPFAIQGKNVLLLGVSYRGGVGDTRFSPVEPFYRRLLKAGARLAAHDPYVAFWPETGITPFTDFADALKISPDIAVISAGHCLYQEEKAIDLLFECDPLWVYDTIGLLPAAQIEKLRRKHTVIVLGRGDL
jgi:UDP-N-acetyl-D-mannosaminuronate dehydrogenase